MNMEWKVLKDTKPLPFRFLFVLTLSGSAGRSSRNGLGRVLQATHAGAILRRGARGPRL